MNGGLPELPQTLAAVLVSTTGGGPSPSLAQLADLFSQIAPLYHALQILDASSGTNPRDAALLVFYSPAAAAEAVQLFHG